MSADFISERMTTLGAELKYARESKMGTRTGRQFAEKSRYAESTIYGVEKEDGVRPSQHLIDEYKKLDDLPCIRRRCEGSSCDKCTISTIVEGLTFHREIHPRPKDIKQDLVFGFDVAQIMEEIGLTLPQQEMVRERTRLAALRACIEVADESRACQ